MQMDRITIVVKKNLKPSKHAATETPNFGSLLGNGAPGGPGDTSSQCELLLDLFL